MCVVCVVCVCHCAAAATEDMTRSKRDKEYNVMLESFGRFVHLFGPFRPSILVDVRARRFRSSFFVFRFSLFAFVL